MSETAADMMRHSELPWAFEKKSYGEYIVDRKRGCVAGMVSITGSVGDEINKANAAFILRAANAHDDLVEALKAVIRVADRNTVEFDLARAALAKAEAAPFPIPEAPSV